MTDEANLHPEETDDAQADPAGPSGPCGDGPGHRGGDPGAGTGDEQRDAGGGDEGGRVDPGGQPDRPGDPGRGGGAPDAPAGGRVRIAIQVDRTWLEWGDADEAWRDPARLEIQW